MQQTRKIGLSAAAVLLAGVTGLGAEAYWVYVGTYTGRGSDGIYGFRWEPATGHVEEKGLMARTENPSFLAIHPGGRHLYAVNEVSGFRGDKGGAVSAFALDPATGALTFLNQEATLGDAPCHLVVDATGRQVLVANYGGGSVVTLPVRENGGLGPASSFVQHVGSSVNARRQKEPHGHSINLSPDNRFAYAADLGTDRLYVYPFDPASGLGPDALPGSPRLAPGAGPRHFAWRPDGRFACVINELNSTLTVFKAGPDGFLSEVESVSTLPKDHAGGNGTAEVVFHPNGRFVYGSNRGHDSIVIHAMDPETGRLTLVGHEKTGGRTPRNFNIDPSGRTLWVANQQSNTVVLFQVDPETGRMEATGREWTVASPVCIRFVPVQAP